MSQQEQTQKIPQSQEEQIRTRVNKVLDEELDESEANIEELDLLQEIYKVATMGMQSVEVIKPMVREKALKNLLFKQFNAYKALSKEIELKAAQNGFDLKPPTS